MHMHVYIYINVPLPRLTSKTYAGTSTKCICWVLCIRTYTYIYLHFYNSSMCISICSFAKAVSQHMCRHEHEIYMLVLYKSHIRLYTYVYMQKFYKHIHAPLPRYAGPL